jgi:hypothetical protein
MEQSANHVLMLKKFVDSINPIWQALSGASSDELQMIRQVRRALAWAGPSLTLLPAL